MANTKYYWQNKADRATVAMNHTLEMARNHADAIQHSIANSIIYSPNTQIPAGRDKVDAMPVELIAAGSVEAIVDCTDGKTAVLNFASYKHPGGGFMAGSRAQEECLCHESFLYNVLKEFQSYYDWNDQHKNNALYENRAIYSPDIRFEHDGKVVNCDVITCAAPNITPSRKYGWGITDEENSKTLESRIKFVLDVAKDQGVDTLILGAWGTGVFGQSVTEVMTLFKKYLTTTHKCFKKVVFAIPDNPNPKAYNEAYSVFKKV